MIEINLLPEEYRKKKVDFGELFNKYKSLVVPGAGILVAIVVIISFAMLVYPRLLEGKLRKLEDRWKNIEKKYEKVVRLKDRQKRLKGLLDNIDKIVSDRIVWARRLNNISDSLPSEIQLIELTTMVEKLKDKPQRNVLIISGLVPPYPGERAIGDFIKGLRENPGFVKDFPDIEPPSTGVEPGGFKRFTIKCYMGTTDYQPVRQAGTDKKPQITQIKKKSAGKKR